MGWAGQKKSEYLCWHNKWMVPWWWCVDFGEQSSEILRKYYAKKLWLSLCEKLVEPLKRITFVR